MPSEGPPAPRQLLCDGCGAFAVAVEYGCASSTFTAPNGEQRGFYGSWTFCADCAALVDADDRRGLARRGAIMGRRKHPWMQRVPLTLLIAASAAAQDEFWMHRTGTRTEIDDARRAALQRFPAHFYRPRS